ncbi:MAG: type 1 glutamine amidotransferase [Syntrophales bacterium]|nr:type 1 glutamine amidotransferase [Syntrophales bacterium]
MKIHFFQHDPVDGPGFIDSWLVSQGHEIYWTKFFTSPQLPNTQDVDMLIILGGPMSANDEKTFPWLKEEKSFIQRIMEQGKPVLGICLGAQLIASSLGARVHGSPVKEIGWFPLQGLPVEGNRFFSFPPSFFAFQWHEETFELPSGSTLLATSQACKNQAFQLGENVIGLQFHLEVTPKDIKAMTDYCLSELIPSPYVQSQEDILSQEHYCAGANRIMEQLLLFLTSGNSKIRAGP